MLMVYHKTYEAALKQIEQEGYIQDENNNWVKDDEFMAFIVAYKIDKFFITYSDYARMNY